MLVLSLALVNALAQQAQSSQTHLLVVSGKGGEERFETEFYEAGKRIVDAARTKYNIPENRITFLAENPGRDKQAIRDSSTKAAIEKAFGAIKAAAKPGDLVFVVLIGHGTSQGQSSSTFALPGPDMTAADFSKLLTPFSKQTVVFVNTASASGDFIGALAGKNRVIVTSTMSPMERNYSKFAKYFSAAYADNAGDANKDGQVSLFEAYEYARQKVEGDYKAAKNLQSEHARLEDNGDGKGTEVAELQGDGRMAARVFLSGVTAEPPQVTELVNQYASLRTNLDKLLARQGQMDAAAFWQELERQFVDLVVISLKLRQIGAGAGGQ